MNENSTTTVKLPQKVRIGYAILGIPSTLQMLLQMYFLVFFYTNILQIDGKVAALIIMVVRIWDFINDPLMGVLVEKTNKPQKCLYWMKRGIPLIAIFLILAFWAPNLSYEMKIVWAVATYVCLGMSATMFGIPSNALRPRLTADRTEQSRLNIYISIVSIALNVIVPAITMPLVAKLQGFGVSTTFMKVAAIYAAAIVILGFIGIKCCDGYDHDDVGVQNKKNVPAKEMFKALVTNKGAMLIVVMQAVKMLLSSVSSAVLVYFCTYTLGDPNIMSSQSVLGLIPNLAATALLVVLFKKFGNAGTGIMGCVWSLITLGIIVVAYFMGVLTPMMYLVCVVVMLFGGQLVGAVLQPCLMDALVYSEYKSGHKNTSVIMAASGIGQKFGLAFGSSVAALVVGLISFDPNAAEQPRVVLDAFFHLTVTSQIVVYAVILVIFIALAKLEKQLPAMQKAIDERNAKAAGKK